MMWPLSTIIIRSDRHSARSTSWVMKKTESMLRTAQMASKNAVSARSSWPAVGSSRISVLGCQRLAPAAKVISLATVSFAERECPAIVDGGSACAEF